MDGAVVLRGHGVMETGGGGWRSMGEADGGGAWKGNYEANACVAAAAVVIGDGAGGGRSIHRISGEKVSCQASCYSCVVGA